MTERPDDAIFRRPAPEQRKSSDPDGLSRRDRRERERREAERLAAARPEPVTPAAGAVRPEPATPQRPAVDVGVSAYLERRSAVEDATVRAAFDDLREKVARQSSPPPASVILARSRRPVRTSRVRVPLVAAASVALVAGLGVAAAPGLPAGGGTTTAATSPTASASSGPTAAATTPTELPTVVVTVTETRSQQPPRTRTRTRTSTPATKPTKTTAPTATVTVPVPTVEVTVYLWQSALYPSCASQYPVKRQIPGDASWANVMRALLSGATPAERAAGYESPFGPDVTYTLDEQRHEVDFTSKAGIDSALVACRDSVEQLVRRTGADAGHGTDVTMNGTSLGWLRWRLGQA